MKRISPVLLLLACACAPKPVLYPNAKYETTPEPQRKADLDECSKKAKEYVKAHKAELVAKHAGFGAAVGAVMGVVFGAFTGDYGRAVSEGAAMGAASGAIGGGAQAATPDSVERRFVDVCLTNMGYQPIGWK